MEMPTANATNTACAQVAERRGERFPSLDLRPSMVVPLNGLLFGWLPVCFVVLRASCMPR
jgi:hypothetical protein